MRLLTCMLLFYLPAWSQKEQVNTTWQNDPALDNAIVAYCVAGAQQGSVLASHNAQISVIPASTLKIFTTAAALAVLGPQYRFSTRICHTGTLDAATGTLKGDLLIIGSGDPTLQSEHFGEAAVAKKWANVLYQTGLRNITGNIVGVASAWERTVPDHWIWADISNYFGAVPCGLSYHDNKCAVTFRGGKTGTTATVLEIEPQYSGVQMAFSASVVCEGNEDKAYVYGDPFAYSREIRGTIPAGREQFSIEASLPDPALLCAEELQRALRDAGVSCSGKPVSEYRRAYPESKTMYVHSSPPLHKIVEHTNLQSNNHYCESLVLALGKGSRAAGLSAIREYWKSKSLDVRELFLADGSGLARASTCTARLQCEALSRIYNDTTIFRYFDRSLPRAGKQGSMSSIGKGTRLENNLRAKTGYIERVRAYCGYLKNEKGQELAFSVIVNHYNCSPREARLKIEQLLLTFPGLQPLER